METWLAVVGMVTVGAATPGPNNVVVLRVAATKGVASATPMILGIVLGGLGLLAVIAAGGETLFETYPQVRTALRLGGAGYLFWLGGGLITATLRTGGAAVEHAAPSAPERPLALFAFQFLNPKAWLLATTAVATAPSSRHGAWWLMLTFTVVPVLCLLLWSSAGALLTQALLRERFRNRFDRAMGGLLIASALLVVA